MSHKVQKYSDFSKINENVNIEQSNKLISNFMKENRDDYYISYDALIPVYRKINEYVHNQHKKDGVEGSYYKVYDDSIDISDEERKRIDPDNELDFDASPSEEVDRYYIDIAFENFFRDIDGFYIPTIEELYEGVVSFLKWYNENVKFVKY
jgi:hypothetical protein